MSYYYEYKTDPIDYSGDDFNFVNQLYEFTDDGIIDPSDPSYYLFNFIVAPPTPFDDQVIIFSFRDPKALNPFNAKKVTGLDADVITAKHYGPNFYNLKTQNRELVITAGLNPNFADVQTYSQLREALYKLIASSRTGRVQIQFKNGDEIVAAGHGSIEKLNMSLFEKIQEAEITVKCEEALLMAPTTTVIDVDGLDPDNTVIQDLMSTAPHGFIFELDINAPFAELIMADPADEEWEFKITPVGGFLAGDILYFSSENKNKHLYIERGPTTIQLMNVIGLGSIWPIIFPGTNTFSLTNAASVSWKAISHFRTYWGV